MDILEPILGALLEAMLLVACEVFVGGDRAPKCKVQTLFGKDVWWNSEEGDKLPT